ncbi:MAG: DUF3127 domain-containing protein [Balneolales bacterium]|nr:DUF3127 domain-containing protein [Balneolales bacterium]
MSLEINATLQKVLPAISGNGKNGPWSKQDFIVEIPGDYPKKVCFTMWGDKANMLQSLNQGQQLKIFFDVESREYNGKWYTDVKAWKIEPQSAGEQAGGRDSQDFNSPPFPSDTDLPVQDDDDFPF